MNGMPQKPGENKEHMRKKQGNSALTRGWVFYHVGCGFGIGNEHHKLYFTMIYVSLTITLVITMVKKKTLQRINICHQSSHIL